MTGDSRQNPTPLPVFLYMILGAALYAFIQSFSLLSPILLSFLLILLISLAVNPLISRMRAWKGGRKGATGLIVTALIAAIALTGWASFVPMKKLVANLSEQAPSYWERFQKPLIKMEQQAVISEEKLQAEVTLEIVRTGMEDGRPQPLPQSAEKSSPKPAKELKSLRSSLSEMFQNVAGRFTTMAFNVTHILVVLVTVFIGATFTLMNPRPIFMAMFSLAPERHHEQMLTIVQRIGKFVPRWVATTLLGMFTIGLLVFLLMWPVFGFMDALVLGLIAGILEAIPFIGPILSAVPAILLALGKGGMAPLWVLFSYIAVQVVENNVILPLIVAHGMKLHPLAVIFSMLLCVAAFGVLGVLIAAPLAAIVDILLDELYRKRLLPATTDADLDHLAGRALQEKQPVSKLHP
ncbi:AI-2E family transporter [Desulfosarcina sp.]|uniref:AI-2E family transporter n=1 Tax=Desulfosarcina sp. TaxID=2027861 RepID=UPI003970EB1B